MHACLHVYVGGARFSVRTITVWSRVGVRVSVLWLPRASGGDRPEKTPFALSCRCLRGAPTDEVGPPFVPSFVSHAACALTPSRTDLSLTPEEAPCSAPVRHDGGDTSPPSLWPPEPSCFPKASGTQGRHEP